MKIEYELKLEDCLALGNYLINTSPIACKTIRKGQLWWAGGPLVGGILLSFFKEISPENALIILAVLGVAVSLPMFFLYPLYFKWRNIEFMKTQYTSDAIKGVIGVHEMTISEGSLNDKTEFNDSSMTWDSVNKIDSTADHTFILTGDVTAYVIPRKGVKNGNYDQFVGKVKMYKAGAGS